jgi:hypothetical protein
MGIEGANQTIFVRRIALRPPISYFGKPEYARSNSNDGRYTVLERFRATVSRVKHYSWVVEDPEDIQSLPPAALGSSGSADVDNVEEEIPSNIEIPFGFRRSFRDPRRTHAYYIRKLADKTV